MASVDIVISIINDNFTTAGDLKSATIPSGNPSYQSGYVPSFVMGPSDISIALSDAPAGVTLNQSGQISLSIFDSTNNPNGIEGTLTLNFSVIDINNPNNIYLVSGMTFTTQIVQPSPSTRMPDRFVNMTGLGTFCGSIDYDCTLAGETYDCHLLIQNATNGAIGIIDAQLMTT